jgi:NodT family efflux transporter outer membrane factor (OMF) lipoprotein
MRHERKLAPTLTLIAMLAILSTSSGCVTGIREYFANGFKVGPNYCPPQAPISDRWIDYQDARVSTAPPQNWAWWRVFNDPVLDQLVQDAHAQNITLREAGFRIEEARALRGIAMGNLFPQQQTVYGQYRRQMLSLGPGVTAGGGGGFPGAKRQFSVWNVGTQLAWEIDFWGRFRRAIEAQDAALDASVENYDDVLIMLIADVARAYVDVRTTEKRLEYAHANVASQQGSVDLAKLRLELGARGRLDLYQAETNLYQTKTEIPLLEVQLRQAQNRLCVLMGMPPQQIGPMLANTRGIPNAPPEIALGIPADLIRRRPDVRRAEREVAAQSARIGIAETDLYPAFTVTGNIFTQANQFNDIFRSRSIGGNVGPAFSWQVFNYFRIRNNIAAEEARFMQEVAQYQQQVLDANREAEDSIIAYLESQERVVHAREAATAAEKFLALLLETKTKLEDFNRLYVAQLTLQQQQDLLAQTEGERANSLVEIYRALGGGWEIRLETLPPMGDVPPPLPPPDNMMMMRDPLMERMPPTPPEEPKPAEPQE